ncbi:MAG: XTP/dITP diphosphatase [Deltaproteobacteria bacterium]|nr:XTP/dITP diphosphatase [Deltaproteobacteria bacterium]
MSLIVATQNKGKLKEICRALADVGIEVEGMASYPDLVPAVEDGTTFKENAQKKAQAIVRQTGKPCLADDSGLTVAALHGRPGVYSARYAGEGATDSENNLLLLTEMAQVEDGQRQAAFCCVMALCYPNGECLFFEGRLEGHILKKEQGDGGFGYDPLFQVDGDQRSLAQISIDEKNSISHRGKALKQMISNINNCSVLN